MPQLGPLVIESNPATGQAQSISLLGLPIGLQVDYEDAPGKTASPPIQLSGITGDIDIIPLPPGPDIETVTMTGPVAAQAVFADNAGGATDSSVQVGNLEQATLLEGFSNRGFESLSIDALGLQGGDVEWGGEGKGPTTFIGTEDVFAHLLHGPGGGTLTNVSTNGLVSSDFAFGENHEKGPIAFPIGFDEPVGLSLLAHLDDRGIEGAAVHDVLGFGNPLDGGQLDFGGFDDLSLFGH